MPELAPISAAFDARTEPSSLDRRYAVIAQAFAAKLRTKHSRRFEVAAKKTVFGNERITRDVPNVGEDGLACLDDDGIVKKGIVVEPGMILVGKTTPIGSTELSPEEKLLRAIFGEAAGNERDTSLRVPPGCFGVVTKTRLDTRSPDDAAEHDDPLVHASVEVAWERPLDVGDVLLIAGEPVVVAEIRSLSTDLAWSGGGSTVSVAKAAMARDVLHARSIGPYSPRSQQPTRGRERFGGQRLEPAQIERLAARSPWALWELLTIKSDSVSGRMRAYESIVKQENPDVLPRPAEPSPVPASSSPAGEEGRRDIFSFFERPAGLGPDEVPAVLPEALTTLVALLHALGLDLELRKAWVSSSLLPAEALREASHGVVLLAETVDPSTQQPIPGGLSCPKIFGPLKDYECACGKYKRMKHRGIVCEQCGVEVIQSKVRRERFGHVELAAPCLHPLLVPEVSLLLGPSEDELREVIAGRRVLAAEGDEWRTEPGESPRGGQAIWDALARVDLEAIDAIEAGPRADLASDLLRARLPATALMLPTVPVLPPGLRPVSSALTERYRVLVDRNARLRELEAPLAVVADEHAQLQLAIDRLMRDLAERADQIFATRVFEKRVDFSGIAHLVADPSLAHDECRLPQAMLVELFKPHAYGLLEAQGFVTTIKSAKRMVAAERPEALMAIVAASDGYPVLLMAGATVVSRRVQGWDAPAIAVDPSTARSLASHTVTVHVPLMHEAALQCASLEGLASDPTHAAGWLCRARWRGDLVASARTAALRGDRDDLGDPIVAAALGRPPAPIDDTELSAWAERERERRARAWERLSSPAEDPADDGSTRNPNLDRRVDELELAVATANALQNAGIETIADLCRRTEMDVLELRGFRRRSLVELKQLLTALGLGFGMRDV